MLRAPSQQIKRMRQHRQNRSQGTLRPGRAARQIHNQRPSKRSAHRTAERSKRSMQQAPGAHALRQSIDHSVADQSCSVRRHIPRSQTRSTRRHNQTRAGRMTPQRSGNQIQLIRQDLDRDLTDSSGLQQLVNRWSGEVNLLPPRAAVANRQHNGTRIGRKARSHDSQSTCFPLNFRNFHAISSAPEEASKMRK
jgi:hypothetical protein